MKRGLMLAAAPVPGFAQGTGSAPLAGKLLITGSSTMAPMVEALGKRFRTRHPGVVITVEAGGSGRGVADELEGKADIGMASRDLTPKEKALFAIPIARDGVVFAVHKDNPVHGLTRAQALELFTGKIANWKALGGPDARVVADKLQAALNQPFERRGKPYPLRASIGIAIFPDDGEQPLQLLNHADAAMYKAKRMTKLNDASLRIELEEGARHGPRTVC